MTSDEVVALARAWIGTPYVHQASKLGGGCDCLGLIRGVWREVYGHEPESIPAYSADWSEPQGMKRFGGQPCVIWSQSKAQSFRQATSSCFV